VKAAGLLLVGLAVWAIAPRPASAYVRYKSSSGKMFMWPQTCVPLVAYPGDLSAMMTTEETLGAVDAAAATWSKEGDACTYLEITVESSTEATARATNDGVNSVIFRTSTWCKLEPNGACDPAVPYDPAALALTSVSASTSTGTIRDADIEINANRFHWADLVAHPELRDGGQFHDLQNAVTHEMGHLIGLDHTCFLEPPAPLDQNGNPIPDCADASPDVLATTMFPSANPGDIDKRTLAPDDQQAVCEIYPADQDPNVCLPAEKKSGGCSCAIGAPRSGASWWLGAAALLLAARPRGRRRR
jgi:hypothetical protein